MTWAHFGSRAIALIATLMVLIAASAIIDRLGAPADLVLWSGLGLILAGITITAVLNRSMRISIYYAAGHSLGWLRSLSLALAAPLGLSLLEQNNVPAPAYAAAVASGLIAAALMYATTLQRAGATSLGAFAFARYRSRGLAIGSGLVVAMICSVVAFAAAAAAAHSLAFMPGLTPGGAQLIVAAAAMAMVFPGGQASIAATAVVVVVVTALGYSLPLVALATRNSAALPPAIADVAGQVQGIGATPDWLLLALAVAGFLACLSLAQSFKASARARSVFSAAALCVLFITATAGIVATAVTLTSMDIANRKSSQLPPFVYSEQARGIVTICGITPINPQEIIKVCDQKTPGRLLDAGDVLIRAPKGPIWAAVTLDMPLILGALYTLAAPLLLIALLAISAHAASTALIGDVFYSLTRRKGTASGKLALHRLATLVLVGLACSFRIMPLPEQILVQITQVSIVFAAFWPATIILPSLMRKADWRTPAVLAVPIAGIALVWAAGLLPTFNPVYAIGLFCAAMLAALALFQSRDNADAKAADVIVGRSQGPILHIRDA